ANAYNNEPEHARLLAGVLRTRKGAFYIAVTDGYSPFGPLFDRAQGRKRAGTGGQRRLGLCRIVVHLADQGLDVVELQLGANEADEGHVQHLAVQIALEVEQEG